MAAENIIVAMVKRGANRQVSCQFPAVPLLPAHTWNVHPFVMTTARLLDKRTVTVWHDKDKHDAAAVNRRLIGTV